MLQMDGGEKNTHGSLDIVEHVWNPLCTNFLFPKLLVSIRQTLAGVIPTSVAIAVHEILHVHSRTDFTFSMWLSSVAIVGAPLRGASSVCYRPFLMEYYPSAKSFIWRSMSLNLPSTTCNTLEHFYLTEHYILLMFSVLPRETSL
jgi:hypothetical protein